MQTRSKSPWLALVVIASIATVGFIDRIVVNVLVEPVKAEFGLTEGQVMDELGDYARSFDVAREGRVAAR